MAGAGTVIQAQGVDIMKVKMTINGEKKVFEIEASEKLADTLRRYGYTEVKIGCRSGDCGSCTVLFNGKPIRSCLKFTAQAEGAYIETVKALNKDGIHPLQKAFIEAGAVQCGFCTPGMLLTAKALLDFKKKPTEGEIKEALKGNLCRCTGYKQQVDAIMKVVNNK